MTYNFFPDMDFAISSSSGIPDGQAYGYQSRLSFVTLRLILSCESNRIPATANITTITVTPPGTTTQPGILRRILLLLTVVSM